MAMKIKKKTPLKETPALYKALLPPEDPDPMEGLQLQFEADADETEDDLKPTNFNQAVTWATDWTTETIVLQLQRGVIDLNPNFQRRDAWRQTRKSRFIESLILGLPIPEIVLAERKEKRGTYIVIDGKQRLLTLKQFCGVGEQQFGESEGFILFPHLSFGNQFFLSLMHVEAA
jgi:hypothetical protein